MRILADENMPLVEAFLAGLGTVIRVPGRDLGPEAVREADVLLVRSITRVDETLLAGSRVRFVGTATIGTDHIDQAYLQQAGVEFASAPGCNAESVADYVIAALLTQAEHEGVELRSRRAGVIGVGQVGSRVADRLGALGIECLRNDPPRAARGEPGLVALEQVLAEADLILLHTPLTRAGRWPTHHLLDRSRLEGLKPGTWLLNAGRGEVVDNAALKRCLEAGRDLKPMLDVWEPEPQIDPELAARVQLATPHIAGYSLEGKCRGTEMLYQALSRHLGGAADRSLGALLPPPAVREIRLDPAAEGQTVLTRLVRLCYDPRADDQRLRATLGLAPEARARAFDRLRKHYPVRREFSSLRVSGGKPALQAQLQACGFDVSP